MPNRFDRDTDIRKVDDNHFVGSLDPGWWIIKGPNGGYLAAILLRAILETMDDSQRIPRSLTVHYLSTAERGEVHIHTCVQRKGRSMATVTAQMVQNDKLIVWAICALGKSFSDIAFQDLQMPLVEPPERATPFERLVPLSQRTEMRLAIGGVPFAGKDRALTGGWFRLRGERAPDVLLLAFLSDAWFPAYFARVKEGQFTGGIPTVDLTIHFRAKFPLSNTKPDQFYLGRFESTTAIEGYVEENGEVWAEDGTLLLQCRQLALLY